MTAIWIAIIILAYMVFSKAYSEYKTKDFTQNESDEYKIKRFIQNENEAQQTFNFNLRNTILNNSLLQEMLGFKNAPNDFSKWTESEKEKWFEKLKKNKIVDKLDFRLTHIPLVDLFIVSSNERTYPVISGLSNRQLYSATLLGDSIIIFKPSLNLYVVERFLKDEKLRVITGYLSYSKGGLGEGTKIILLFDFPYALDTSDEIYNKFEFNVERSNSDPYPSALAGFREDDNRMDYWNHTTYKNKINIEISTFS